MLKKNGLNFEERDWASVLEKDLQVALKLAFASSSSFLVLDLLNQVQLRNQGSMSLNVDGLRHGTQLYVQICIEIIPGFIKILENLFHFTLRRSRWSTIDQESFAVFFALKSWKTANFLDQSYST
jgi:hypothetical protein